VGLAFDPRAARGTAMAHPPTLQQHPRVHLVVRRRPSATTELQNKNSGRGLSSPRNKAVGLTHGFVTASRATRTGLINLYPGRKAASIVVLAAFKVAWVSRAILPFAIKLRSLAFRVVVE